MVQPHEGVNVRGETEAGVVKVEKVNGAARECGGWEVKVEEGRGGVFKSVGRFDAASFQESEDGGKRN